MPLFNLERTRDPSPLIDAPHLRKQLRIALRYVAPEKSGNGNLAAGLDAALTALEECPEAPDYLSAARDGTVDAALEYAEPLKRNLAGRTSSSKSEKPLSDVVGTAFMPDDDTLANSVEESKKAVKSRVDELSKVLQIGCLEKKLGFKKVVMSRCTFKPCEAPVKLVMKQDKVHQAMKELTAMLKGLATDGQPVTQRVVKAHEAAIQSEVRKRVEAHYRPVGSTAIRLPSERRQPPQQRDSPKPKTRGEADARDKKPPQEIPKLMELGPIESPFLWLPDQAVAISLLQRNGDQLLLTAAQPPAVLRRANQLRKDPQKKSQFEALWERLQARELELAGQHARRIHARGVDTRTYGNRPVFLEGSRGCDSIIQYLLCRARDFGSIAAHTAKHNIPGNTPLLVLVGETTDSRRK